MRDAPRPEPALTRLQRALEGRGGAPPPAPVRRSTRCEVCDRALALVAGMCAGCRARMIGGMARPGVPGEAAAPAPRPSGLLERMPGVIYRASPDRQRRLSYVSDTIADLCGIPAPEFRSGGAGLARITHPDDRELVREALGGPGAVDGYDLEYRILTAEGEVRWVNDRGRRSGTASPAWDEGLLLDVTGARQTYERLLHEARHDPLTGTANRRAFAERLHEECARAERTGTGLSLVCADADHFKRVNDTHGHEAGDRVLVGLAERLEQTVRVYDTVARIGGEEFAVILIGAGEAEGLALAERIRAAVAGAPCGGLEVTVSLGCSGWRPGDAPDELLRRADEALYAAKHAGRNRVAAAA